MLKKIWQAIRGESKSRGRDRAAGRGDGARRPAGRRGCWWWPAPPASRGPTPRRSASRATRCATTSTPSTRTRSTTRTGPACAPSAPDCHVPREPGPLIWRKMRATFEIWGQLTGVIDTKEKFEAHRYELAKRVWTRMKETDSLECRNCHHDDAMSADMQSERAQGTPREGQGRGQDLHRLPLRHRAQGTGRRARTPGAEDREVEQSIRARRAGKRRAPGLGGGRTMRTAEPPARDRAAGASPSRSASSSPPMARRPTRRRARTSCSRAMRSARAATTRARRTRSSPSARRSHGVVADARTPTCTELPRREQGAHRQAGEAVRERPSRTSSSAGARRRRRERRTRPASPATRAASAFTGPAACTPGRDVACTSCHNSTAPHDKVRDKLTQPDVCFTCHKEQRAADQPALAPPDRAKAR